MKRRFAPYVLLLSLAILLSTAPSLHAKDMVTVDGAYGTSAGFTTDKFMWKNANGDYQEKNWRYIYGDDRVNTYDRRIFDRYEINIETHTGTPWNGGAFIKIDPWSFLAVGEETLTNGWNDSVHIKYKYWENTGATLNETYRTSLSNAVRPGEMKVLGGRITPATASPQEIWTPFAEPNFTPFSHDRSVQIQYLFRGVRKGWVEYKEDPVTLRIFPISDQYEALTSDDPMRLCNNRVYWGPSPWLFDFDPGMQLMNAGNPIQSAKWNWDLVWQARDTNRTYLTFLRGATFSYKFKNEATLDVTAASPMSPWDYYETINSVPVAARFKMYPINNLKVGSVYTSKYGIYKHDLRGNNQLLGFDFDYNIGEDTHLIGEYAASSLYMKEPNYQQFTNTGYGYKLGAKSKLETGSHSFSWDAAFTNMSQNFAPGLSDYRDTRIDRDWGRHIWFDPIPAEDAAIRIGDSVDVNRYVFGANASASLMENLVSFYMNMRNVHNAYNNKFIENVGRFEATYNPLANLQFKGLALYRQVPLTQGGLDPWLYDRYWDVPYPNDQVLDHQNADLMTFSGGAKVDLYDNKLTVFGVYEATNDPQDFPRRELNYLYNYTRTVNNINFSDLSNTLYGQWLWDAPPYGFYSIIKGVVIVRPVDRITIRYTHVTNGNQNYASLLDDNHNHDGIDITYAVLKKLTVQVGYAYSRIIDINRALSTNGRDRPFEPHNNVYAQAKYDINRDHNFIAQFGEFGLLEQNLGMFGQTDPGMGYLTSRQGVLDTRCIVRLFYQGKF